MSDEYGVPISQIGAMTHWPEQPNPVPPIVEAVRRYLQSGDYNPVHEPGTQPADYLRELARNPDIMAKNIDQASQFNFGGVTKPITAYHGSSHDFDRFDLSRIGTGEGAQAYGHGLYFAENEGVAKDYKTKLAGGNDPMMAMAKD